MRSNRPTLGLYIHIPFCRSKCLYCDFCSFPNRNAQTQQDYVDALCRDLAEKGKRCATYEVDTVYLGGGTPTVLSGSQLERIIETVYAHYRVTPHAEITAECNPSTGQEELFVIMHRVGINRLSIGLQSIHDGELKALGRTHRYADFLQTILHARHAGFDNLSADLMFGIPGQTPESFAQTLEEVTQQDLQHLSAYSLTVEEGTPFYRMGDKLPLPDEDAVADMYANAIRLSEKRGFLQYEISNFAKKGYESRHNLKYWNCDPYLGFGPGAHSCMEGVRFGNSRDIAAYIEGRDITEERQILSAEEAMNEYVMLRMRLCEGVNKNDFADRFGVSFDRVFGAKFARYVRGNFVTQQDTSVSFTSRGFAVSNTILADVLDFSDGR